MKIYLEKIAPSHHPLRKEDRMEQTVLESKASANRWIMSLIEALSGVIRPFKYK